MEVKFGKWVPDLTLVQDPSALSICTNVLPIDGKYLPAYGGQQFSEFPLTDTTPLILVTHRSDDGSIVGFTAGSDYIHKLATTSLININKVGTVYSTGSNQWDFDVYGNAVFFTNYADPIQVKQDVSTSDRCVDLPGSPPKAKCLAMYKDHLFAGYTNDGSNVYPRRVRRSAKGNVEDWTINTDTGAGYQDLASWGDSIVSLRPYGDYLLAYMTNSIWVINDVGTPWWFSYEKLFEGPGPLSNHSVVPIFSGLHAYLASDDIYLLKELAPTPQGSGLRKEVINSIDLANAHRITHSVDYKNKLVKWAYPSTNSDGTPDKILVWNWENGLFSVVDLPTYCVGMVGNKTITISNLDEWTINELGFTSLDSSFWGGSGAGPGFIDRDKYISKFTGSALHGIIKTHELDLKTVNMFQSLRPQIYDLSGTMEVTVDTRLNTRETKKEQRSYLRSNGLVDLRTSGRYASVRFDIYGDHQGITGFDVDVAEAGNR